MAESWSPDHCEYWRRDLSLYTADTNLVPQARLLRKVDYNSAKELSRLQKSHPDAQVLNRLQQCGIALRLCGTPDALGTNPEGGLE